MKSADVKKILILNGSPKREHSATINVTKAFVEGLKEATGAEVKYINLADLNIKPCTGCLSCWGRTEGECIIKGDDIPAIKKEIEECDIFIESYPLFFFGMPGTMKVFTDRMLSMMNTYMGQKSPVNGESVHGIRNPKDQKFIIITSCAYTEYGPVYEPLIKQYDCICGKGNYTMLFAPQLKTLMDLNNASKIDKYLSKFKEAGIEFGKNLSLSDETYELLKKPPFTEGAYKIFLNNFWTSERERR